MAKLDHYYCQFCTDDSFLQNSSKVQKQQLVQDRVMPEYCALLQVCAGNGTSALLLVCNSFVTAWAIFSVLLHTCRVT